MALWVMAITEGLRPAAGHACIGSERTATAGREKQRAAFAGRHVASYCMRGGGGCQHAKKWRFLHERPSGTQKGNSGRIAVWWKTRTAMPRCRNMWTHGRGLLRRSHAIL